jgi:hypothetical protein
VQKPKAFAWCPIIPVGSDPLPLIHAETSGGKWHAGTVIDKDLFGVCRRTGDTVEPVVDFINPC